MAWPGLSQCTWQLAEILVLHPSPILSGHLSYLLSLSCSILILISPGSCPARESCPLSFPSSQRPDCSSPSSLNVGSWQSPGTHYLVKQNLTQLMLASCAFGTNLLAVLDFFCSQVHDFLLTHPTQLLVLLIPCRFYSFL